MTPEERKNLEYKLKQELRDVLKGFVYAPVCEETRHKAEIAVAIVVEKFVKEHVLRFDNIPKHIIDFKDDTLTLTPVEEIIKVDIKTKDPDVPPEWTGDLDSIKAWFDWCVGAIKELQKLR